MTGRGVPEQMSRAMSCDEVAELAGLFVLDALEPSERRAVLAHLSACPEMHAEIAELGGVVPALASLAEPLDGPPDLKGRVLAAVADEAADRAAMGAVEALPADVRTATPRRAVPVGERTVPAPVITLRGRRTWSWASVGAALAAVLIIAVVGVWAIDAQARADRASQRAAVVADALEVLADPRSSVAILRATAGAPPAGGFAAFSADGVGYLVLSGLTAPPQGQTYQAWHIVDGSPSSAGLLTVDADGYAVLAGTETVPGTDAVALTIEPAIGSIAPTSQPILAGDVQEGA